MAFGTLFMWEWECRIQALTGGLCLSSSDMVYELVRLTRDLISMVPVNRLGTMTSDTICDSLS